MLTNLTEEELRCFCGKLLNDKRDYKVENYYKLYADCGSYIMIAIDRSRISGSYTKPQCRQYKYRYLCFEKFDYCSIEEIGGRYYEAD